MDKNITVPKMTRRQAKIFWNSLSAQKKAEFNDLYGKLLRKELILKDVVVDDNEQIQRIILEDKKKPVLPIGS